MKEKIPSFIRITLDCFKYPIALRKAKVVCSCGLSECNGVKRGIPPTNIEKVSKDKNTRIDLSKCASINLKIVCCCFFCCFFFFFFFFFFLQPCEMTKYAEVSLVLF